MVHTTDQQLGRNVLRKSFSKTRTTLEIPNLIEIQTKSYKWFLEEGLMEVLRDVSPIVDYSGNLSIEFISYSLDSKPKYPVEECKERDVNYAAPLKVNVRLTNKLTGEVKQTDIYMGDFPLMTDNGTFVINGAERVIVSQIIRSPGIYYESDIDKTGKKTYAATVIPYRGAWLEYEIDSNGVMNVRIDKNRKLPVTMLIRALGLSLDADTGTLRSDIGNDEAIYAMFGEDPCLRATIEKDESNDLAARNRSDAAVESLREIYKKLRPGEPVQIDAAMNLINNYFFDPKKYDIAPVGRYKFDKKLAIGARIANHRIAADIVNPLTGEVLYEAGKVLSPEDAKAVEDAAVNEVTLVLDNGVNVKVFSNNTCWPEKLIGDNLNDCGVREKARTPVLLSIMEECGGDIDAVKAKVKARIAEVCPKHITHDDIFASINYMLGLTYDIGTTDDIDHLGNRRIRSVGEQLQNQMRIGFSRMDKIIKERMTTQDTEKLTPQALINIRPVATAIREFFGSSQLSQFMDQANPLAELTHKRRLSALGPGGLSRERASFDVRDVHYSHYGRMCPIETPEGPNIGLISYLAAFARVNEYGFLITPYRRIERIRDENGKIIASQLTDDVEYMTADIEDRYIICEATEPVDENRCLINHRIICRHRDEIIEVDRDRVDYIDISPRMMVSIATAMIPFLENDDANRALMGANMQRQAVPLLTTQAPIVGTGIEHKCAVDSGVTVLAEGDGVVTKVSATGVSVKYDTGEIKDYELIKFSRSNQGTCFNQRPIVDVGERVHGARVTAEGIYEDPTVLADGPSTAQGELSLGKNILVGFMSWEGYNYEDAILLNERLVMEDVFTSLHVEEYECDARDTKLGPEEITRDIPGVGEDALKYLDERGIIMVGAEVHSGDILVGKVTPKGETDLTAEERLLRAIFGEKAREVRDTSLKVPHGANGIVVDVKVFTRENGDEMGPGVNEVVRVYIAQKRKIGVGDKMAGRHGNKGVVSRILPKEDMPYLPDGTPLDIVLNPLGVPSRMNIGQVLEVHLGYAAQALGWKVATPIFNGANEEAIHETLRLAGLREDGKSVLYDGRTGERFDNDVTVGWVYFLKLHHLVDDKMHARSTGPYSLVTQQPLGGKAQFGGQRFGEMEVWALEAYGAAYTLQEILTVKSDDVTGRVRTYESIVKGHNIPQPGVPESFKVLVKELQSLCLDVKVLDAEGGEIELKDDEEDDFTGSFRDDDDYRADDSELEDAGYAIEDVNDELNDYDDTAAESDYDDDEED